MEWRTVLWEVAVAALAVIGFYSLLQLVGEALCPARQQYVAVILREEVSPAELDILLDGAVRARRQGQGLLLALAYEPPAEGLSEAYAALILRYGAEVRRLL